MMSLFAALLRGVYRISGTKKAFALPEEKLLREVEKQNRHRGFFIDMTRCPYHDACVQYGCPELCHCFCDSDDITYDGMHPKLLWHRTKTLGRGDECCDFSLKLTE